MVMRMMMMMMGRRMMRMIGFLEVSLGKL